MLTGAHPELADRVEHMQDALGKRVVDAMYASNPFWQERFGERGRRFALSDAAYHLSYLASALRIGSPSVFTEYARWLRTVLVTRGMCTRHLGDNFRAIESAVRAHVVQDTGPVLALLEAAQEALRYTDGLEGRIEAHASEIASSVRDALYARHPEWGARHGEAGVRRCADDVLYHLAYLADAIHVGQAGLFRAYVELIGAFLARRGLPPGELAETLDLVRAALAGAVPPKEHDMVTQYMQAALPALGAEAVP